MSGLMLISPLLVMSTIFVRHASIQMCDLRQVRQYLTDEAAILAANFLMSSCFDYSDSVFRSLFSLNMHKLQGIQNTVARIVTNCNK